ncbi:hypothetical protein [Dyella sp. 333MFSha]|uniref:hypothetical protein n=1 Tax=Dyella sp. 333MFSha TaxID=1798240 RepID=UPI00115FDE41|nr:hypothetical protein [Dyella sp. 333MFSha]
MTDPDRCEAATDFRSLLAAAARNSLVKKQIPVMRGDIARTRLASMRIGFALTPTTDLSLDVSRYTLAGTRIRPGGKRIHVHTIHAGVDMRF